MAFNISHYLKPLMTCLMALLPSDIILQMLLLQLCAVDRQSGSESVGEDASTTENSWSDISSASAFSVLPALFFFLFSFTFLLLFAG